MGVIIFEEKKTFLVCIFLFYNSESMTALPVYQETTKCKNHSGWIHWEQISQKCFCCFLEIMPKIDTLDALEEHEERDDDYQTVTN